MTGQRRAAQPGQQGAAGSPDAPRLCGYVGCGRPAARRMLAEYAHLPWFGCEEHADGMYAALLIGQPQGSAAVQVTHLTPPSDPPTGDRPWARR